MTNINNNNNNLSNAVITRLKNRSSVHFGHVFDYSRNTINKTISGTTLILPKVVQPLMDRLCDKLPDIISETPDQLTINRYEGDDHIPPHIDTHSMCTDWVVSISVHSDVVMTLTTNDHHQLDEDEDYGLKSTNNIAARMINLPARSALVMSGEARYHWRHGIRKTMVDIRPLYADMSHDNDNQNIVPPQLYHIHRLSLSPRALRYSFTFRRVCPPGYQCQCPYPESCDVRVFNSYSNNN